MYIKSFLFALPAWFEENLTIIISAVGIVCLLLLLVIFIGINRGMKKNNSKSGALNKDDKAQNGKPESNEPKDQIITEAKQKSSGKYVITAADKNGKCSFILKAANNQVIFGSRDYASQATCKEGIVSFRTTVKEGTFSIEQDKSGRFQFRLQRGSQIYEGETVSRKDIAEKTIVSIKNNFETEKIVNENKTKKERS